MKLSIFKTTYCSAFILLISISFQGTALAQGKTMLDPSKITYNEISTKLKLAVFPSKKQTQEQQKKDELACYSWAQEQTGIDPLNMPVAKAEATKKGRDGSAVRGAAKGAAAGAAVGAVAGDAGEGAAIGATAGALKGAKGKRTNDANQAKQAEAKAAEQNKETANTYKKAFVSCMKGKGYSVE